MWKTNIHKCGLSDKLVIFPSVCEVVTLETVSYHTGSCPILLLLLLSEHSIASTWVENEVEAALEKEDRQQREVLFPARLDDAVMQTPQAWAATLRRTRHIGDFSRWTDPQAYLSAFDRLLRDLKQT